MNESNICGVSAGLNTIIALHVYNEKYTYVQFSECLHECKAYIV